MESEENISDDILLNSSSTDVEEVSCRSSSKQKKRARRKNKFQDSWKSNFNWITRANDEFMAKCISCGVCFSIANGGIADVKRHLKTTKHIRNMGSRYQKSVSCFLTHNSSKGTEGAQQAISAAEAAFTYHTVSHSHSYKSADCSSKLFKEMFADSNVASNFKCGRTKMSKIAINILAKHAIKTVLDDLAFDRPFSISTDASNKGNIKTFPLVLRYFCKHSGVNTKLLNFYNLNTEMSIDIAESIKSKLENNNLNLANVTSFCADNANVNFGYKKSVFVELKKCNPDIIGVGCLCHIINNAFKNALKLMKFDIENIVIKVFNEFSSSTKRTSNLKEFFEFCDLEWSELLRHVPTRWLSLNPAVERLLKNYAPIKTYFLSKDDCSAVLREFFESESSEAYLGFIHNIGVALSSSIKKLEEDTLVIVDMFKIVIQLRDKFEQQKSEKFYGYLAETVCRNCDDPQEISLFKRRAEAVLSYIITYIEEHFDLKNNKFEKLSVFNLNSHISFHDFTEVIKLFGIKNIDMDLLFDEFLSLKTFAENVKKETTVEEKWKAFLNSGTFPNFEKICNFIFSIPHSNAATERIFSCMFSFWRKERNRLLIENLESELIIKTNYDYTCIEFLKFLKTEDGKNGILKDVPKNDKYL